MATTTAPGSRSPRRGGRRPGEYGHAPPFGELHGGGTQRDRRCCQNVSPRGGSRCSRRRSGPAARTRGSRSHVCSWPGARGSPKPKRMKRGRRGSPPLQPTVVFHFCWGFSFSPTRLLRAFCGRTRNLRDSGRARGEALQTSPRTAWPWWRLRRLRSDPAGRVCGSQNWPRMSAPTTTSESEAKSSIAAIVTRRRMLRSPM